MPYALDARATALPRSLALSSLSYLTLVVLLLFARTLFHAPATRILELPPIIDLPPNNPGNFVPQPPGATPVQPRIIPPNPLVIPVDNEPPVVAPDTFSPPTQSSPPGLGSGAAQPGGQPGTGGSNVVVPEPGTFEYTESLPVLVHKVEPVFPEIARQAGMDGKVTLWMRVGVDGRVQDVRVVGEPSLFDTEATKAARQFVFTPATSDGHPVAVWVRMGIRFVLRD